MHVRMNQAYLVETGAAVNSLLVKGERPRVLRDLLRGWCCDLHHLAGLNRCELFVYCTDHSCESVIAALVLRRMCGVLFLSAGMHLT